jgi:predicted dehydrogenase
MLGPVAEAAGMAGNQAGLYPADDIVTGTFRFRSGVLGTGTWCFTAAPAAAEDTVEITGDLGKVSFPALFAGPIRFIDEKGAQQWSMPFPPHVQQPLIQTVVDQLRGVGKCPSTGQSAARTSRVLDQITAR